MLQLFLLLKLKMYMLLGQAVTTARTVFATFNPRLECYRMCVADCRIWGKDFRSQETQCFRKWINLGQSIVLLYGIYRKKLLHFTWDMICCNFIFISKASANCNSQVGMTSMDANLLKNFFKFYLYFLHHTVKGPRCFVSQRQD